MSILTSRDPGRRRRNGGVRFGGRLEFGLLFLADVASDQRAEVSEALEGIEPERSACALAPGA